MISSCVTARGMAIRPWSMARNISYVCRTVGCVGEYLEQLLYCMIEPAPRNSDIQFENICCLFFQHSWKLSPLHLLLPGTQSMFRLQSENIRLVFTLCLGSCSVKFWLLGTRILLLSLGACANVCGIWIVVGFFASLPTLKWFFEFSLKMCLSAFFGVCRLSVYIFSMASLLSCL